MNKYILRGAIIGGIWGFIGDFFMIATFLSDIGYARFFTKASNIQLESRRMFYFEKFEF